MKFPLRLLLALLCLPLLGMGHKKVLAVRFFAEANPQDTDRFAEPLKLQNPPRDIYIEKIPRITERNITAIYPFEAGNGTWGCTFQLEESGRLDLEVLSTQMHDKILVAFIATDNATHQVANMIVDRPIHDGIITIPHGLTSLELYALTKEFRVIKPKQQKKGDATIPGDMTRKPQ